MTICLLERKNSPDSHSASLLKYFCSFLLNYVRNKHFRYKWYHAWLVKKSHWITQKTINQKFNDLTYLMFYCAWSCRNLKQINYKINLKCDYYEGPASSGSSGACDCGGWDGMLTKLLAATCIPCDQNCLVRCIFSVMLSASMAIGSVARSGLLVARRIGAIADGYITGWNGWREYWLVDLE